MTQTILKIPPSIHGVIIEADVYKGGSTAKLSLVAQLTGRKLVAFDSFQGLPSNSEIYTHRDGLSLSQYSNRQ